VRTITHKRHHKITNYWPTTLPEHRKCFN